MNYLFKLVSILWLILATLLSSFQWAFADLSGKDTKFIATAYYSPLPGQSRYATGSYAGDIRLNGPGKTTASGKAVFEWLLAAPAGYDYGTKIHFKWYWVGQVEDRWGAIVRSWVRWFEHDRIDIWMWYGDEGLNRALRWGKRTIEWKVVDASAEPTLKLGKTFLGKYGWVTVGPDSPELDILKLQELFIEVDLYSWEIDGKYESVKDAIIDFQIKTGVVNSRNHDEAWYFWNKSRDALREDFDFWPLTEESAELYDWAVAPAPLTQEQKTIIQYDGLEVSPESSSELIENLQRLFSEVGLYKWTIDGNYKSIEWTLLSFQIGAGIVDDKDDWWAGYYGEKTRKALFVYFAWDASQRVITPTVKKELETTLSTKEIRELDSLINKLKKEVEKIAKRKNKEPSEIFTSLSKRIDILKKRNIKPKLKEKLIYIQKNI